MGINQSILIMGVSGAGKTTIGSILAKETKSIFVDADNFHSSANIIKMKSGSPLNDQDRIDWLIKTKSEIVKNLKKNNVIVACSALKKKYRDCLNIGNLKIVFLKIDKQTAFMRIKNRKDHFMPVSLVEDQFKILSQPKNSIICDAKKEKYEIVNFLLDNLNFVN
tara:strand:- start:5134 stop:5628 length:495 start_codon:yes stop_codon:yes gene_type:complete